jgi:hypothetical protein
MYDKIVYLASPYRAKSEWMVYQHIENARYEATRLWNAGFIVINPIGNTAFFGGVYDLPDKVWLDGDLVILSRCDILVLNFGWKSSSGCCSEREYAIKCGLPVYDLESREDREAILNFYKDTTDTI